MNELEKKFSCLCGSEVKEANRKAHEKTKKHTNFQQSNSLNNMMPVHNLPPPKPTRKRKYSEVEKEEDYEDDEEDPEHEQGDEEDDGFEEELMQALELIHKGIEELAADKVNLRNDMTHRIVQPLLSQFDSIHNRLRLLEERLTAQVPSTNPTEPPKWINDKCTPRN
jgi:TATA-binding protein-associated factor Taf7